MRWKYNFGSGSGFCVILASYIPFLGLLSKFVRLLSPLKSYCAGRCKVSTAVAPRGEGEGVLKKQ